MTFSAEVINVTSCSVIVISRFGQIPKPCNAMAIIEMGIISPTSGMAIRLVSRKFVGKLLK